MRVNSAGIYSTRPWKIYGEGPSTQLEKPGAAFNEAKRKPLTAEDVRFTTRGNTLYAFIMGWPQKEAIVQALGTASGQSPGKIADAELLGHPGRLSWSQEASGLRVQLPPEKPSDYAITMKIVFA
jgi:alpha-L-fucosidase